MKECLIPGAIAKCKRGYLGLIINVSKFADTKLYTGINLGDEKRGYDWQSIDPTFVCYASDLGQSEPGETIIIGGIE